MVKDKDQVYSGYNEDGELITGIPCATPTGGWCIIRIKDDGALSIEPVDKICKNNELEQHQTTQRHAKS